MESVLVRFTLYAGQVELEQKLSTRSHAYLARRLRLAP